VESNGTLRANIRLERKQQKVANTLAYNNEELINVFFWFFGLSGFQTKAQNKESQN
jgi:hypothetical protein